VTTTRGPCPLCDCGPRDTALVTTTDEIGTVSYCHRCGYTVANNIVTGERRPIPIRTYRPWRDIAAHLWQQAQPLRGSIAETYLRGRGCRLPPEDGDLRFLPARDGYFAAMLARVTDAVTGEPISLHFTRLAPDGHGKAGTDRDKLLLSGHRKSRGCIRLWPDEHITSSLTLAEGIESALAAANTFAPTWSTVDAGNLGSFPVLGGIETLTIIADHDPAGLSAADSCARCWRAAGHTVRVLTPRMTGEDAADIAQRMVAH
jgi:putative DNA primase/helicase